jgi:hypothetical protein
LLIIRIRIALILRVKIALFLSEVFFARYIESRDPSLAVEIAASTRPVQPFSPSPSSQSANGVVSGEEDLTEEKSDFDPEDESTGRVEAAISTAKDGSLLSMPSFPTESFEICKSWTPLPLELQQGRYCK